MATTRGLREGLAPLGIQVKVASTPMADAAVAEMQDAFRKDGPVTWVVHEPKGALKAYRKACRLVLKQEPWWNVPPDMFFAVQMDDGPQFYLCLMGNGGAGEVGYLIVDDWAQAQAMLGLEHEAPRAGRPRKAAVAKGIESVSLQPRHMLSPADAHYWQQGRTAPGREVLLPVRYEGDTLAKPKRSLAQHAALLDALAHVPELEGPGKAHVDSGGSRIQIMWPAEMHR